ncbi:MAG: 2-phospho-L-lactate guanylyltransferase [Dehalococcoidia bacterium]
MIRALVPAKALGEAKGRLASTLSVDERRELALAMLTDVLMALRSVVEIDGVSVISPDSHVLGLATKLGATPIAESANVTGIGRALERAISSMSPPPDAVIIVLGDLPEVKPEDVRTLIGSLPERGVAASPSADGGTSAMAARPPHVIEFHYGPKSFARHREQAAQTGVEFREVPLKSLARDMDTAEDLRDLLSRPTTTSTQRLLTRLGVAERLHAA